MSIEESKVVADLLHRVRRDSEIHSNQASQMMDFLGKDHHDSKVQGTLMNAETIDSSIIQTIDLLDTVRHNSQLQGSQATQMIKLLNNDQQSSQTGVSSGNFDKSYNDLELRDNQENAENEPRVSKAVKSQMVGVLDAVRNDSHWLAEKKSGTTFLGSPKEAKIPSPRIGIESYSKEKTLREIEVKGYVKRLKDGFPDRKFEINYDNRNYIKIFAPYAPLHRKPSGDDTSRKEMWKVPYDNQNYAQALIYGESSRDSFHPGDRRATDYYRFYDVERNVYDYAHGKCKVSLGKPPEDEEKKTSDNYRFWDVERNIHDFEDQTSEVSSGGRKPSERKDNDYYYSYIETSSPDNQGKSWSHANRLSIPEIQEQHKNHKNDLGVSHNEDFAKIQEQHKNHKNDLGVSHNEDFAKYLKDNGLEMTINTQERWTKQHHRNDDQGESTTANKMEPNVFRSLVTSHSDDIHDKIVPQIR